MNLQAILRQKHLSDKITVVDALFDISDTDKNRPAAKDLTRIVASKRNRRRA